MTSYGRNTVKVRENLQALAIEALARYAANDWEGPSDSLEAVTERVATAAWESEAERKNPR